MRHGILLCVIVLLAPALWAQGDRITFEHFSNEDGLSAPVTKITQDSIGFLWLATTDGLNRFDGKNFIVYRNIAGDESSLPNNIINDFCVGPRGRVWIATNGGLCRYDFRDDAFHQIAFNDTLEKIDRHRVHAVTTGNGGRIWFATRTLLHLWQEGKPVETYHFPEIENLTIKYLYEDAHGNIWIGTNDKLFSFNPASSQLIGTRVTSAFSREKNLSATVHPILPYSGDTLLIGSWYGGVHKVILEGDSIHCISFPDTVESSPRKHIVRGMGKYREGYYWIGTYGNGISLFNTFSGQFVRHLHTDMSDPKSLSTEYVTDVFTDASGIVWVGTDKGLDKFDPLTQQFTTVSLPAPPQAFSIYRLPGCIVEDHFDRQAIWVTVSGVGLYHYNTVTGDFRLYQHDPNDPHSLPDNSIYVLYYDKQERIWIGMSSGVCLFDALSSRFLPIIPGNGSIPHGAHQILQDKNGVFWFATFSNGIFSYDAATSEIRQFKYDAGKENSLPDNRVFCLTIDHAGNIWIGMQNRGLCMLDPTTGRFAFYEHDKSDPQTIPDNGVYDLYEDESGHLWIATENGLASMDLRDLSFHQYTTASGLCNNDVFSIARDHSGNFWLATNNGLSRYDPATDAFKNYYTHDGLPYNSISGALFCGSDGTLYFGTTGMITYCKPEMMKMNQRPPPVVITHFKVFDKQRQVHRDGYALRPINLSYRDNMITFDFSALNFTNSNLNQYAYQLEGFDNQWIYCGYKQSATYTNLDGGSYVFHVKAANNDGVWNETGTSVSIIVHPPYWRTWWFYALCVLAVAAILYALYRFRINQLMKLQQIRTRISRDLHDDIGSTLSSINMISSMATRSTPDQSKAGDLFETISSASRQAMELMSDIVWSINPKNDKMEMIIIRMRQYASEILEAAHIPFTLKVDDSCNTVALPIDKRKDFYLIFKEAINNVAKYSRAIDASIHLKADSGALILEVCDQGIGFDPEIAVSGNGLRNMRARAGNLRGDISIIAKPGYGTQITLKIPLTS